MRPVLIILQGGGATDDGWNQTAEMSNTDHLLQYDALVETLVSGSHLDTTLTCTTHQNTPEG